MFATAAMCLPKRFRMLYRHVFWCIRCAMHNLRLRNNVAQHSGKEDGGLIALDGVSGKDFCKSLVFGAHCPSCGFGRQR